MMLTDTLEDLELIFSEECQCEASHAPEHPACSDDVVAHFSQHCEPTAAALICSNMRAYVQLGFDRDGVCAWCAGKIRECWVVRPI